MKSQCSALISEIRSMHGMATWIAGREATGYPCCRVVEVSHASDAGGLYRSEECGLTVLSWTRQRSASTCSAFVQCRDPAISVTSILAGKDNDGPSQTIFVFALYRTVALRAPGLPAQKARTPLTYAVLTSTGLTALRRRSGLRSFPRRCPSAPGCPCSGSPPDASASRRSVFPASRL